MKRDGKWEYINARNQRKDLSEMKKSLLCLILVFALLSSLLCTVSFADGEETYKYIDEDAKIVYTYTIVKGGGPNGEDSAKIVSVTIGSSGFLSKYEFERIYLKTDKIRIPEYFDDYIVTHIAAKSFDGFGNISTVVIPENVVSIDGNPFAGCSDLNTIILSPDNQTFALIDGILYSKADKRLVCFPNGMELERFVIPQGILSIGEYAISGNSALKEVIIPDSITYISDYAFYECYFRKVTIPDSVTYIGDYAFYRCLFLKEINIPDSLMHIGDFAFFDTHIKEITIPASLISIGAYSFAKCSNVDSIIVSDDNQYFSVVDGILYSDADKRLVFCPPKGEINKAVIPDGITHIDAWAFYDCSELKEVIIPASVTHIGNYAIDGCISLTLIVERDSYAANRAKEKAISYNYPDTDNIDWLNS